MAKDSFLDTNIIINYVNFDENFYKKITKKCYDYIIQKNGKFILCLAVVNELYKIIKKRSRIHKTVLKLTEDEHFDPKTLLSSKEIPVAKKLYLQFKDKDPNILFKEFLNERKIFEMKIEQFLKREVDDRVIPLNQIDHDLVNKIHEIIPNYADCMILASALQLQKTREIFLFVTADGKDLDPNSYEYLKEHLKINYPTKDYKFPELLNLIFRD